MTDEVSIRAIDNAWLIEYKHLFEAKAESYKSFAEVIERLKTLLNTELTEENFTA
jgi:uncharacterized protein (DUF302 family)